MTKAVTNTPPHSFIVLAYQESPHLETCIKSVLNQAHKSEVLIATTTPNPHIENLAKKYHLEIVIGKHTTIGGDFDFALNCAKTPLATIAHQDDVYEKAYAEKVIAAYEKCRNSSIIFTDYFEIRNNQKIYQNANLKIKRLLLLPFKIKNPLRSKHFKRFSLKFGCAICCPTVTFVRENCPREIFASHFKCDCDWHAWEKLSRRKNPFTFISEPLMGHRISLETTTTEIIKNGVRTKEDYEIFCRFWPKPIAKLLAKFYQKSEKSNDLKN